MPLVAHTLSAMSLPLRPYYFKPEVLFSGGEKGAWFEAWEREYLFQPSEFFANNEQGTLLGDWEETSMNTLYLNTLYDQTGTIPDVGDPVGFIQDLSGNGNHATQSVSASRGTYQTTPDRIVLDKVDDNYDVDFTGSGGFSATLIQGSEEGVVHAKVNVPDGVWSWTVDESYFPSNNVTGMILVEGTPSQSLISNAKKYLKNNGAGDNFAGVTSMSSWFRSRTDITALYSGDWDVSSVTNFIAFALNCSSLTVLDVSDWDTSSVTNFSFFVYNCSSLTALDVSSWDTSSVTNFSLFAFSCSSLTTLDVSSWDTSSVTNFNAFAQNASNLTAVTVTGGTGNPFADSPCTDYTSAFSNTNLDQTSIDSILVAIESAGTSGGTFNQSGGSAPSATGETAIDALRGRGWTITVTGGY